MHRKAGIAVLAMAAALAAGVPTAQAQSTTPSQWKVQAYAGPGGFDEGWFRDRTDGDDGGISGFLTAQKGKQRATISFRAKGEHIKIYNSTTVTVTAKLMDGSCTGWYYEAKRPPKSGTFKRDLRMDENTSICLYLNVGGHKFKNKGYRT